MAAFAILTSLESYPLSLSEAEKGRVFSALQERAPGQVEVYEAPGIWAAASGPWGGLVAGEERILLYDGTPEEVGEGGGRSFLDALVGGAEGRPFSEERLQGVLTGLSGSFSACLYDRVSNSVTLLRDRFGTRPVFYAQRDGLFMAASECKMLQAFGLEVGLEPTALRESLAFRWVTGESSLLSPTKRVPRGSLLHVRNGGHPTPKSYWRYRLNPDPFSPGDFERYQDQVDEALRQPLKRIRSRGKPVGILLSGGVDSSLLSALAVEELGPCIAYTARIPGFDNFELERAQKVAAHLGMDHRVVDIDTDLFREDVAHLVRRLEELPRHPNDLVLLQILRAAAEEVRVIAQGDAADTFLGGRFSRRLKKFTRKRALVGWMPNRILHPAARFFEGLPAEKAWKLARVLAWDGSRYLQARDAIRYLGPVRRKMGLSHLDGPAWESGDWKEGQDPEELRRGHLVSSGIQGSLIRHDRLSRPLGLESVTPYLAPEILAVAQRMPGELRGAKVSKPVLRSLCDRYLPDEVSRWKKGGFQVPWGDWMCGVLLPLCQEASEGLKGTGFLPEGFLQVAMESRDGEGAWSGLCLYLILKEFRLL